MKRLRLLVPGKPVPQGRLKFANIGGFVRGYYGPTSKAYRAVLVKALETAWGGAELLEGPCRVEITAWGMNKKADADNLAKQVLDAMVGIVLIDDNWTVVTDLAVSCRPSSAPDRSLLIEVYVGVKANEE